MQGEAGREFPSNSEGATGLGDETVRHPQARFAFFKGMRSGSGGWSSAASASHRLPSVNEVPEAVLAPRSIVQEGWLLRNQGIG